MAELKIGDVVQLKSGGPKMTIADTQSNPAGILCAWFDKAEVKSSRFPPEALAPIKKSQEKVIPRRPTRKLPLDAVD